MTQTQEKKGSPSATERAEDLLDRAGRSLGLFVASTGQRVQRVATVRGKSESGEAHKGKQRGRATKARTEEAEREAMERADVLVEQMEQRARTFAVLFSSRVQKTTARLREEVEDMWAEAQHIHQQSHHQS